MLMDEPTAAISVRQVAEVLNLIRRLRDHGIAVVLISHRMPDVFAVADRIVVLRRGEKVADKAIAQQLAGRGDRPHHRRDRDRLTRLAADRPSGNAMATTLEQSIDSADARQPGWPGSSASRPSGCRSPRVLAFVVLSLASDVFATQQNLFNVTRNFAFVAHHRASA